MKKDFFKRRTIPLMLSMDVLETSTTQGLVHKILALSHDDVLIVRSPIKPAWAHLNPAGIGSSRQSLKHGVYVPLDVGVYQAHRSSHRIPLDLRRDAFTKAVHRLRESESYFMGFSWMPLVGDDRRMRVLPFEAALLGSKIYSYSVHMPTSISVDPRYGDAASVLQDGAKMRVVVPSTSQGKDRYVLRYSSIVTQPQQDAAKRALSFCAEGSGSIPGRDIFSGWLKYESTRGTVASDALVIGPHMVAGYLAIINQFMKDNPFTCMPLCCNPLVLPSRVAATLYDRMNNNVLVFDKSVKGTSSKNKYLRHAHVDETSIMIGRAAKVLGHDAVLFWDPARDGLVSDYWKDCADVGGHKEKIARI